jgi:hypothetical protein
VIAKDLSPFAHTLDQLIEQFLLHGYSFSTIDRRTLPLTKPE